MTDKIIDQVKIVRGTTLTIEFALNELIKKGWSLHGNLCIDECWLVQMVVKYKISSNNNNGSITYISK